VIVTAGAGRLRGGNRVVVQPRAVQPREALASGMHHRNVGRLRMLIVLGVLLAIAWLLGLTVLKVSSLAIHLLILFAVVSIIVHFVRGRHSTA
jgi:hypothetical protein